MPRVKVRMFATVREAAGTSETEVDAASLEELMERLAEVFGRSFEKAVREGEGVVVLVNGRNVDRGNGNRLSLNEDDEVSMFPPVSGG